MNKTDKKIFIYIAFAVALFALVMHLELIGKAVRYIGGLFAPVAIGAVIAFMLNVPVCGFEKLLHKPFKNKQKKPNDRLIHLISVIFSLLSVILVVAVLCVLVFPKLLETLKSIANIVETQWPEWMSVLSKYNIDTTALKNRFSNID